MYTDFYSVMEMLANYTELSLVILFLSTWESFINLKLSIARLQSTMGTLSKLSGEIPMAAFLSLQPALHLFRSLTHART